MGNKLGSVRPARHILSLYRRTTVFQIVNILKSFKSKFSFQAALLSRDDFLAITLELYRQDADAVFDHLTTSNPFVAGDHMLTHYVGSVEFFLSLVLLCSPKQVSFDEKLDMAMALCQFRPTSDNMPLGEPDNKASKEQIRFLFECSALILSKVAHTSAPSYDDIIKVSNELFGENSSFIDPTRERDLLDWEQVKLCIQCNPTVLNFLAPFLSIVNLMDRVSAINDTLLEIRAQILEGIHEEEEEAKSQVVGHAEATVTGITTMQVLTAALPSTRQHVRKEEYDKLWAETGLDHRDLDTARNAEEGAHATASVEDETETGSVLSSAGALEDAEQVQLPIPPAEGKPEPSTKAKHFIGKIPKMRRPSSARKRSVKADLASVAAASPKPPKVSTSQSTTPSSRRNSLMRDKMQHQIEHISTGGVPSLLAGTTAVNCVKSSESITVAESQITEPELELIDDIKKSEIVFDTDIQDASELTETESLTTVATLNTVHVHALAAGTTAAANNGISSDAPTAVPPKEPVSSSAKDSAKRRLFKAEVVVAKATTLKLPPPLFIPSDDAAVVQQQPISKLAALKNDPSLVSALFSTSKANSKRGEGVSVDSVKLIDRNIGVQDMSASNVSTRQHALPDTKMMVSFDNCIQVLLSNSSISVPELTALELCTIEKCLRNMIVENDKILLASFLELCRCIISFNVVGISSAVEYKNVINITQLSALFCLTNGVGNPLPNKAIILHTGQNLLAYDANIPDDVIERAAQLQAYTGDCGDSSRPISPSYISISPRARSPSPNTTGFLSALSSPRGAMMSPRSRVPFHSLLLQYVMITRAHGTDSKGKNGEAVAATCKSESAVQAESKPETVDLPIDTGATGAEKNEAEVILKPSDIISLSKGVGELSIVLSGDNSRCTTPDLIGDSDGAEMDSCSNSDIEDDRDDSANLIGRASWIYYVDQNKCNGLIDEELYRLYNALVKTQQQGGASKDEALASEHIPTLVKSRIGSDLLDLINCQLEGLVKEVAMAHVEELVRWFMDAVVPDSIEQVLWIDVHRHTKVLLENIRKLDVYVRQLCD